MKYNNQSINTFLSSWAFVVGDVFQSAVSACIHTHVVLIGTTSTHTTTYFCPQQRRLRLLYCSGENCFHRWSSSRHLSRDQMMPDQSADIRICCLYRCRPIPPAFELRFSWSTRTGRHVGLCRIGLFLLQDHTRRTRIPLYLPTTPVVFHVYSQVSCISPVFRLSLCPCISTPIPCLSACLPACVLVFDTTLSGVLFAELNEKK